MQVFAAITEGIAGTESKGVIKKVINSYEAIASLGWDQSIDGVKFDGKAWVLKGSSSPAIKVAVTYDTVELRYTKETGLLAVKVRTYMI